MLASTSMMGVGLDPQLSPGIELTHQGTASWHTLQALAPVRLCNTSTLTAQGSAGGCSGEGLMWDLQSSQGRAIAKHEAPIRHMQFLPQLSLLVTGSWDRTVAYWDARTAEPALRVQLPERVYAMHSASSTLVVGTAARHVQVTSAAFCKCISCDSYRINFHVHCWQQCCRSCCQLSCLWI